MPNPIKQVNPVANAAPEDAYFGTNNRLILTLIIPSNTANADAIPKAPFFT